MQDFISPVEEMLWTLRCGADAQRLSVWDEELAQEVIRQAGRFIDSEIAPLDGIADHQPPVLANGRVQMASPFVDAYSKFVAAGWPGICAPETYGGQELPHVLGCAVSELLSGACVGFQTVLSLGQGATRTILAHGSVQQREAYLPSLIRGDWLATMCLTEPTAGSDLSQIRTLAKPVGDGKWEIHGGKIFITGGDQNLTDNVVHLVLARTPDAAPGVRGLSLFLCPAVLPDGERNRLTVLRLEEKMGLHASPTCQLSFEGATAELLGEPGEGLARMFTMMNATRLDVGTQGVGLAQVAMQRAWNYAAERRQGRAADSQEAVDLICRHTDVQRMLFTQRALVMGIRAMIYRTMVDLETGANQPLVEFMTPVCKAFATEAAVECANLAIQVHGGYGYLREYRVEQILRDARITCIYEGTNGIQAATLAGRILRLNRGACAEAFEQDISDELAQEARHPQAVITKALADLLAQWKTATEWVQAATDPGASAHDYLQLTGLTAFTAAWSRLARNSEDHPSPELVRTMAQFVADRMSSRGSSLLQNIRNAAMAPKLEVELFRTVG